MSKICYVASGEERQQAFASFEDAVGAAKNAPWSDGHVYMHYMHYCAVKEFSGYAEVGIEVI